MNSPQNLSVLFDADRRWFVGLSACLIGFTSWFYYRIILKTSTIAHIGQSVKFTNWEGLITSKPKKFHKPRTKEEIIEIIKTAKRSGEKVRVVGAGHSWSPLVQVDDGHLISLDDYNKVLNISATEQIITVQAGIRLKDLNVILEKNGLALANLGSVTEQSIAGAISTGTHGTGEKFGPLATQITEIEIITSEDPYVIRASEDNNKELFDAARISIGSLGIISELTIKVVPLFKLHWMEEPVRVDKIMDDFDKLSECNDHCKIWWFPHTNYCQLFKLNRTDKNRNRPNRLFIWIEQVLIVCYLFEFILIISQLYPSKLIRWIVPFVQKIFHKKDNDIDISYNLFSFPVYTRHSEMEYSVPREYAKTVWKELIKLINEGDHHINWIMEIRWVKSDDNLLSHSYGRDSVYFGVMKYRYCDKFFSDCEKIFTKYGGRPHWGKWHSLSAPELRKLYPRWDDFQRIRDKCDPSRVFTTPYISKILGP